MHSQHQLSFPLIWGYFQEEKRAYTHHNGCNSWGGKKKKRDPWKWVVGSCEILSSGMREDRPAARSQAGVWSVVSLGQGIDRSKEFQILEITYVHTVDIGASNECWIWIRNGQEAKRKGTRRQWKVGNKYPLKFLCNCVATSHIYSWSKPVNSLKSGIMSKGKLCK